MAELAAAGLVLGLFSGLTAGLFGIGGGMIIVPGLTWLLAGQGVAPELRLITAVATSLATIIFTSISAVWMHHRLGAVLWPKVARLTPGVMFGSVLGAMTAAYIDTFALRVIFIGYLLAVGVQMALAIKPGSGRKPASAALDGLMSILIGLTSALVGIGGGTMTVPYLVHYQTPMRNAVAVASACGLPIALAGTLSYMFLGSAMDALPTGSIGYIYAPAFFSILAGSLITAPVGARLANRLPGPALKRYFSVLVFILAIKMIWS